MQKSILMRLMALPLNLCIYALIFPVMANSVLASPSLESVQNTIPPNSEYSWLFRSVASAHSPSFPRHDLGWDKLASRDEQQPGRECILIGRCRG